MLRRCIWAGLGLLVCANPQPTSQTALDTAANVRAIWYALNLVVLEPRIQQFDIMLDRTLDCGIMENFNDRCTAGNAFVLRSIVDSLNDVRGQAPKHDLSPKTRPAEDSLGA